MIYENLERAKFDSTTKFELSEITNFDWDYLVHFSGNESVVVPSKIIEPFIGEEAEDLDVNYDRFYFLQNDKVVKAFDIYNGSQNIHYKINFCKEHITLKRSECNFAMKSNTSDVKKGTVLLYAKCEM